MQTNVGSLLLGIATAREAPDDIDVVLAHFAWAAASAADGVAAIRGGGFAVFAHAHDIFDRNYVDQFTTSKLQHATLVAVESDAIRREVADAFQCATVTIRMGVPPDYFAGPDLRDPDPGLVVSVGSLLPKKGHDLLVQAIASLPDARLAIIGEGPAAPALRALADDLGCGDRVTLPGTLQPDEVKGWLDRAAVFALRITPASVG